MKLTVALDWLPNTNHSGLYVAREKGWYQATSDLEVDFVSPHTDNYKATPGCRVRSGEAQFAVAPSESVISSHTAGASAGPPGSTLQAVAAVLQTDQSAIVTLKSSGISRPSELDGRRYASYGARYEGRIVQQLIRRDGGKGTFTELTPGMLGIWNTLLKGEADATWVFEAWEGVEAQRKGVELNAFRLSESGIPYGYSPVIVASTSFLRQHGGVAKKFLQATAKGYEYAAAHPDEAADILCRAVAADTASSPLPEPLDLDMVRQSQQMLSQAYLDSSGRWGMQTSERWDAFLDWLSEAGLLTTGIASRNTDQLDRVSLDELRSGKAGQQIPRSEVKASSLFTSEYLSA